MNENRDAVRDWVQRADTGELLDRATVLRGELEPSALEWIDTELVRRGVSASEIESHGATLAAACERRPDGSVRRCWRCGAPATARARRWWRVFGLLPVLPVARPVCGDHA